MTLSERLLNLRMDGHLTLRELSLKTNLSISFLSDLEHGRSDPSLSTLVTLSRAYGIRLVDLLWGVDVGDEAAEVLPHDDREHILTQLTQEAQDMGLCGDNPDDTDHHDRRAGSRGYSEASGVWN